MTNFYRNIFRLVRKSNLIKFDQVWSSLDRSDLKKLKNKTVIFILSVNETTFYSNIFRLVRKSNLIQFNQVWTNLFHLDPIWSSLNMFEQVWTNLIHFDPIQSSLIRFDQVWTTCSKIAQKCRKFSKSADDNEKLFLRPQAKLC